MVKKYTKEDIEIQMMQLPLTAIATMIKTNTYDLKLLETCIKSIENNLRAIKVMNYDE